jgi:predicted nucleic acid-binding protein
MIVGFDTNILVYATAASPAVKTSRARDVMARGIRGGSSVLLLQTLAEFSNVAIRKARIPAQAERRSMRGERCFLCESQRRMTFRRRLKL